MWTCVWQALICCRACHVPVCVHVCVCACSYPTAPYRYSVYINMPPLSRPPVRVYCSMIGDMFHSGHVMFLRQVSGGAAGGEGAGAADDRRAHASL